MVLRLHYLLCNNNKYEKNKKLYFRTAKGGKMDIRDKRLGVYIMFNYI
jgi:hypothetical protein